MKLIEEQKIKVEINICDICGYQINSSSASKIYTNNKLRKCATK